MQMTFLLNERSRYEEQGQMDVDEDTSRLQDVGIIYRAV
jgi:hypothetical protein